MLEHIVKNNETLENICNLYHVSEMELKWNNSHITDWNNIPFGVKLWIPTLSVDVEQVLDKTEPFVMDYYPEISDDIIPTMQDDSNLDNKTPVIDDDRDEVEKNKNINNNFVDNSPKPINNLKDNRVYRTNQSNFRAYSGIYPPKRPYKGR